MLLLSSPYLGFAVHQLLTESWSFQQGLNAAYVDRRKAFGSVDKDVL